MENKAGLEQILARRRIPGATYRLQLNADFTFKDALAVIPYLQDLGITDIYLSPILLARPGSTHGYDICDYSQLNPTLGTDEDFDALSAAAHKRGMGILLDMVPNHMGVGHDCNHWWMDVLENGPSSIRAAYFDISWQPVKPELTNKVLLPILGDQYGDVLENGQFKLIYDDSSFCVMYYETRLPLDPRSYAQLLSYPLEDLVNELGADHEPVQELQSILTALSYLPSHTETDPEKVAERHRENGVIKKRIATLIETSPDIKAAVEHALDVFNGTSGDPHSFDLLDNLLKDQPYRPAFWRVAADEINYRRFFDINTMAAVRVEQPDVFEGVHERVMRLLAEGKIDGLRIDHPDGLWNPTAYFREIQVSYLTHCLQAAQLDPAEVKETVEKWLAQHKNGWPLYVVAEKILSEKEPLPLDWAVHGTTGYDFLNAVNGLLVDRSHQRAFDGIYSRFIGGAIHFPSLTSSSKQRIMNEALASEIRALSLQLERITEASRRYRDFTLTGIRAAMRDVIAEMSIYRTYITGPDEVSTRDQRYVDEAVEAARRRSPSTAQAMYNFVRDTILLRNLQSFDEAARPLVLNFVMKFQQLTGPVMAKSVEDTAFYIYNRLVSLNEVGGHPEQFGSTIEMFHRDNTNRLRRWPHAMLATSTHDTKRGEDTRARINVLSEIPQEWETALEGWNRIAIRHKTPAGGEPAPDRNEEYLLYQILLGAWLDKPDDDFRQRITDYMIKAANEAKVHTSWINPDEEYSTSIQKFVAGMLRDPKFLNAFRPVQQRVAFYGLFNSISQTLLKLTAPGMPDIYQGSELWNFSLVDPDNRRPVDYKQRRTMLSALKKRMGDRLPLVRDLLEHRTDGRIKLYLTHVALQFRQEHEPLFSTGDYLPLAVEGSKKKHVVAFARVLENDAVIVVVPRLFVDLTGRTERLPLGSDIWQDTRVILPPEWDKRNYQNLFTGEVFSPTQAGTLSTLMNHFPAVLLKPVS